MITIIGALIGFFSSSFPSIISIFKAKQDNAQQLAIMDKQIELQKIGASQRLEEIKETGFSNEIVAMYNNMHTGVTWVDALNGIVRPIWSFVFLGIFLLAKAPKIAIAWSLINSVPFMPQEYVMQILDLVWDDNDDGILAAIMAFYFGGRGFEKLRKIGSQ